MKSAKLVLAVAVATLGFSSLSFAESSRWNLPQYQAQTQQNGYRVGPPVQAQAQRGYDNRAYDNRRVDNRGHDNRGWNNRGYNGNDGRYVRPVQYQRGGYVPAEYRGRQYVVNDWRERRLQAPQQGQQWVNTGTNLALIAVATGLIASIVLN